VLPTSAGPKKMGYQIAKVKVPTFLASVGIGLPKHWMQKVWP
jgi:hypothetical protein